MNRHCLLFGHDWVEERIYCARDRNAYARPGVPTELVPATRRHCSRMGCSRKGTWEYVYDNPNDDQTWERTPDQRWAEARLALMGSDLELRRPGGGQ